MKLKRLIYILSAASAVFFLSACDYLLPLPLGRDNPADDEAQIGGFSAAVSGIDSITVVWGWLAPAQDIPDDQVIDKIRIVHKVNDPPSSVVQLNKEDYTDISDISTWQFEWRGLQQGEDQYFALYAHEKGGKWLSPKIEKKWINSNVYPNSWSPGFNKFYISSASPGNVVTTASTNVTGTVPGGNVGFFEFYNLNDPNYGIVSEAAIRGWNVSASGDILIVPVRIRLYDSVTTWGQIAGQLDYQHAQQVNNISSTDVVEIKEQINLARVYGSNTIAFIAANAVVDVNIDPLTFWDGSTDRFTVWENN